MKTYSWGPSMAVVNKYAHTPTGNDEYIGRGSILGNPFIIGRDGDRSDCIKKYERWLRDKLEQQHYYHYNDLRDYLLSLRGKNLICFCAPRSCHGDIVEAIIEELYNAEN